MVPENQPQPEGRRPLVAARKMTALEMILTPFMVAGIVTGALCMIAAPFLAAWEGITWMRKGLWPGWSLLDWLNRCFYDDHPLFLAKGALYSRHSPHKLIDFGGWPGLTGFVNEAVCFYLDSSVIPGFFLSGAAIFGLAAWIGIYLPKK
jgi:hypothetical protein